VPLPLLLYLTGMEEVVVVVVVMVVHFGMHLLVVAVTA
jgi:hypothetical protein